MAGGENVRDILTSIGIPQYLDKFLKEGFDSWTTICDATETDLDYMDVKLGHRRKLQRAINESKASPAQDSTPTPLSWQQARSVLPQAMDARDNDRVDSSGSPSSDPRDKARTKRKYRRHPKTDANAPVRPSSAYVLFAQDVREQIKEQELDFSAIAKTVGSRWQNLPAPDRDRYDQEANSRKDKYMSEMADYRKTIEYEQYQRYLQDFKTRNDGRENKARRTEAAGGAGFDDQDDETRSHPRSRSASDETRPFYKPLHNLQLQSDSQSPASRSSSSMTPVTLPDDAWTSQANRLHGWGPQSANQASPAYHPPPIWSYSPNTGQSSQHGSTQGVLPMHNTHSSASTPPYAAAAGPQSRHMVSPRSQEPYRRSNYTAEDPRLQPRDGRGPHVPALLNPTRSHSQHTASSGSPHHVNQARSPPYDDSSRGRAQWRGDTLPDLYNSTSSHSSNSLLNTEESRPSPPRSPHTGRMIDGELTPPPRPAEAAAASAANSSQQFPLEKTMEKTSRRRNWETVPGTADALLDHDELGSYRPKQNVSEMRSKRSPRGGMPS